MDCLIVIGCKDLKGLPKRIIDEAGKKLDLPIIEINEESAIKNGYKLHISENMETSVDILFNEYYRLSKLK